MKVRQRRIGMIGLAVLFMMGMPAAAQQQRTHPPQPPPVDVVEPQDIILDSEPVEVDPVKILIDEVKRLREELFRTRQALAEALMQAEQERRELEEMRQFISDHREYGEAFERYRAVKEIAEREARQREALAARERREAERAERQVRMAIARQAKEIREAESSKLVRYRRAGFKPVGLDVYAGKMAFFYDSKDGTQGLIRIDYDPLLGNYLRPIQTPVTLDYSSMTVSGSVLNGSDEIRNIGVAITFFDEHGNQVGHEIIKVNNARPDVPYPFTSKIDMALNRAFESSSIYVLYADVAEDAGDAPPATPSQP